MCWQLLILLLLCLGPSVCTAAGDKSGTTATVVIVAGWLVTVAAVGDSRALLDTGVVTHLSMDHRFEENKDE